jgi:hypothetical protein
MIIIFEPKISAIASEILRSWLSSIKNDKLPIHSQGRIATLTLAKRHYIWYVKTGKGAEAATYCSTIS